MKCLNVLCLAGTAIPVNLWDILYTIARDIALSIDYNMYNSSKIRLHYTIMAVRTNRIEEVRSLVFFGHKHVYPTKTKGRFAYLLDKRANELMKNAALVFTILIISGFVYSVYPLYKFVLEGIRPTPVPIILPFVDPDTQFRYILNLGNQFFVGSSAAFKKKIIIVILQINFASIRTMWESHRIK